MAHSHEVPRVSGALVAAHFTTTTLPVWGWWDTEQRLWLQDAECTTALTTEVEVITINRS